MTLNGITFTTEEGETIALDKDYVSEVEQKEIQDLRKEEIRERTYRRHIKEKQHHSDEKNGRVIKWSKERILRENMTIKFKTIEDSEIKNTAHAMISVMRNFKDAFTMDMLRNACIKEFGTVKETDTEDQIKQRLLNKETLEKGLDARFTHVYYALGCKQYEKLYKLKDQDKLKQLMIRENPLIIRWRNKEGKFTYRCLEQFYTLNITVLFKISDEFLRKFNNIRFKGVPVKDININVRNKYLNVKIDNEEIKVNDVEDKPEPEQIEDIKQTVKFYEPVKRKLSENSAVIERPKKMDISEKTRITYYIIDKIFANPKPGTTMKINNDASIEFKF